MAKMNQRYISIENNEYLKGRNAADNADVNIIKINDSDVLEFGSTPKIGVNDVIDAASLATELANYVPTSQKAVANGVASLDGNGKVPVAQLPNSIMEYQGTWDASSNTPTLANGAGNDDTAIGNVYRVSAAGSVDFGAGAIAFDVGDYVILNANKIWEKSDTTDAVATVNGQTGNVVLDTDDIDEGSTNLYFTDTRARTAAVVNSTAGNETDQAASVAAMKAYVAANASNVTPAKETFTLAALDISNGYVDLAQAALAGSMIVQPVGGAPQQESADYTLSVPVAVTRVTFAGDLAANLAEGDVLLVQYIY